MGGVVKPIVTPVISTVQSAAQDLGIINKPAPTPTPAPIQQAPSAPVVSQSSATNSASLTEKNMRRGRSPSILTSPTGETLGNPGTTINKPTLLGQ